MRGRIFFSVLLLLLLNGAFLYAQTDPGLPCNGNDPDSLNPCPLDTWVIILAIAAVIFASVHLYRKESRPRILK